MKQALISRLQIISFAIVILAQVIFDIGVFRNVEINNDLSGAMEQLTTRLNQAQQDIGELKQEIMLLRERDHDAD